MSIEESFEQDFRNPKRLESLEQLDNFELSGINNDKSEIQDNLEPRKIKRGGPLHINLDNSSSFDSPLKEIPSPAKRMSVIGELETPGLGHADRISGYFDPDSSNIKNKYPSLKIDDEEDYSDEEIDDVESLFPKNIDDLKPQEKNKINPMLIKSIFALKSHLNSSVNASINASRRSFMKKKAAVNLGEADHDKKDIKKKLENLQKLRVDSLKHQNRLVDTGSEHIHKDSKELEDKKSKLEQV